MKFALTFHDKESTKNHLSYYQGLWHAVLGTYELYIKLCRKLYNNFYFIKQMRKYYVLIGTKYDSKKKKEINIIKEAIGYYHSILPNIRKQSTMWVVS